MFPQNSIQMSRAWHSCGPFIFLINYSTDAFHLQLALLVWVLGGFVFLFVQITWRLKCIWPWKRTLSLEYISGFFLWSRRPKLKSGVRYLLWVRSWTWCINLEANVIIYQLRYIRSAGNSNSAMACKPTKVAAAVYPAARVREWLLFTYRLPTFN